MTTLWGDSKARWGSIWHSWAGAAIPLPRARSVSVLPATPVAFIAPDQLGQLYTLSPYGFPSVVSPEAPPTWGDLGATWGSFQFTWGGREIVPAAFSKTTAVLIGPAVVSVFARPGAGIPVS